MTPRQVFDAEKEDLVEKLIVPNKGKTIEVSGVIDSLYEIGVALRLDPPIDEFTNTWVVSIKDPGDDNWTHAGTYAPGQTVKLQSNGAGDIIDFKWKIVESESNPAPIIQASELAKAFQATPEETNKKYNGKQIYLVGEIAKHGDDYTWLKGAGDFNLQCIVDSSSVGESTLKEGDQVQLLGEYSGDEKSEPVIGVCIVVRPKLPVPGVKYAMDVGPPKQ